MKVLSDSEVTAIVDATTKILAETGVKIDSEKTLNFLKEKGLPVDMDEGTVKFPESVQRECLASAPKTIPVVNRQGERLFTLGEDDTVFASGHNAVFFDDVEKGEHRQFTLHDVDDYVAVSHHLQDIDMIGLPASPAGVNSRSALLYALRSAFANSNKPVYFSTDSEAINHYAIEMTLAASADAAGRGAYMISQLSPTSPLFWEKGAVEGIVECAERRFPVAVLPEPITGVSAPYSLAGLITVHNAEAISGICITQLVNPGTPVIWASSWTTFDMKKSAALVGSIETTLCRIGGAQVAKYYKLPLHTTAPNSDNHAHDVLLPYILPPIIIGLTLLIFIRMLNIKLSMFTIILGHIAFTTPIVVLQVSGRLERMGPNYQFAAQDLGANPVQTFFYITLPMIKTALIGAGLLAFTVSFDEIIISYFLTGTWMTLPVYIYGMMRFGLSSKIFAISSVVLVMSLFIVVIMSKYIGRAGDEVRVKKQKRAE